MAYTIEQIAAALGAEAVGDVTLTIERAAEPGMAGPGDLALAMSPKYAEDLGNGTAQAAIVWPGADWAAMGLRAAIMSQRPRASMSGLTAMLDPGQGFGSGIHASAVVDPTAQLGANVTVGPLAVIAAGARIGAGSVIGPHCYVGADVRIGENAFLREMVSIGARAIIGDRLIAQPGARVGADGFSLSPPKSRAWKTPAKPWAIRAMPKRKAGPGSILWAR